MLYTFHQRSMANGVVVAVVVFIIAGVLLRTAQSKGTIPVLPIIIKYECSFCCGVCANYC